MNGDAKDNRGENTSASIAMEAAKIEYEYCLKRSEKLDNKVYIMLTVCAFLFVMLTDIIKVIERFAFPSNSGILTLIIIFSISLTATVICFFVLLVMLINLLSGIKVNRFLSDDIINLDMVKANAERTARYICSRYVECKIRNNTLLEKKYNRFNKCIIIMIVTIALLIITTCIGILIIKVG